MPDLSAARMGRHEFTHEEVRGLKRNLRLRAFGLMLKDAGLIGRSTQGL